MKLIINIPAHNEEKTIGKVIKTIPRQIFGIKTIKVLVIDDGSVDNTRREAKKAGADYIISNKTNRGLGYSFQKGINTALEYGADIIVNIDADYQYNPKEIPKLIEPVLKNKADMVIGNREIKRITHMPLIKKYGNLALSKFIRSLLNVEIQDVFSGFRAFSRSYALKIQINSNYTYTLENLLQAVFYEARIKEVSIKFMRRKHGNSRLIKSLMRHLLYSGSTILKMYVRYSFQRFLKSRYVFR